MTKFLSTYLPYYKDNLKVSLPLIVAQLGQILVQQADSIMLGHKSEVELAASSLAGSIFIIGFVIGMGFSLGLTPLIAHALGQKDPKQVGLLVKGGFVLNIAISLVLITVLYIVSLFMDHMNQPPEVVVLARPYFHTLIISLLPFMIFFTFKQFFEGLGSTKSIMVITILANILNIILNYFLIFGNAGFPELGILGAGYATLLSRVFMVVAFVALLIFSSRKGGKKIEYLRLAMSQKTDYSTIKKLFLIGYPIAIQLMLETSAFGMSAIMAGWISVEALAGHQIALGLASTVFMVSSGMSGGTTIRVAHHASRLDHQGLKRATFAAMHIITAILTVTALLFISFNDELPLFYVDSSLLDGVGTTSQVVAIASSLILIASIFQLYDGLQVVLLGVLRGLKDVKYPMYVSFLSYLVINIPVSYIFAFKVGWGIQGVWFGFIFSLAIAAVLFYRRFLKQCKLIQLKAKD